MAAVVPVAVEAAEVAGPAVAEAAEAAGPEISAEVSKTAPEIAEEAGAASKEVPKIAEEAGEKGRFLEGVMVGQLIAPKNHKADVTPAAEPPAAEPPAAEPADPKNNQYTVQVFTGGPPSGSQVSGGGERTRRCLYIGALVVCVLLLMYLAYYAWREPGSMTFRMFGVGLVCGAGLTVLYANTGGQLDPR
jgi:hypothetical protein